VCDALHGLECESAASRFVRQSGMASNEIFRAATLGWVTGVEAAVSSGEDLNRVDPGGTGQVALHYAAENGHSRVVELLLKAGASVAVRDFHGQTPLHAAASGGHLAVVRLLLEHGAELDARGRFGRTPLHAALAHPPVVSLLLDLGAEVDVPDKKERTPLHWCAAEGYLKSAQLLLENGADVEASTATGWTPLFLAARNDQADLLRLLLEAGADACACDTVEGHTPSEVAASALIADLLRHAAATSDGFAQADRRRQGAAGGVGSRGGGGGSGPSGEIQPAHAGAGAAPPGGPVGDTPSEVAGLLFEALGLKTPTFLASRIQRAAEKRVPRPGDAPAAAI
jgi:hypothetical protein